jgi:hypothetical protein
MNQEVDRFEYLMKRRFPGFTEEVQMIVKRAWDNPRKLNGLTIGDLPALSLGWDFEGCSLENPLESESVIDETDVAYRHFLITWIKEARAYEKFLDELPSADFFALYM